MQILSVILVTVLSSNVHAWSDTPSALGFPSTVADATATTPKPLSRSGHDNDAFKAAFTTCPQEIPPTVLSFPSLPTDFPVGTCFRNGHGRFESDDGMPILHPFDGDGLVSAITFDDKRVLFRNRFVRTEGYVLDKSTGTMSRPGVFGTRVSGGWIQNIGRTDVKHVANTNVLYSNGVLYALWESGWPYRLDPLTLENNVDQEPKGFDMNGLLGEQDVFAAHYRYDPLSGTIVNFGVSMDPVAGTTTVYLYELDADMNSVRDHEVSLVLEGAGVIHDFLLTQHWHIFSVPTASVNNMAVVKALLGLGAFCDAVDFRDETLIVCVPRHGGGAKMNVKRDERIKVIKVPSHRSYHCANAFETEDGNVVVDIVVMDEVNMGTTLSMDRPIWETVDWDKDMSCPRYVRFVVHPESETMVEPPKVITSRVPELPAIPRELSTRQHRYAYTVGSHKEFDGTVGSGAAGAILKVDTEDPDQTEAYSFMPHEFVGEPIFVPKMGADVTKDEDRGYIVVYVVNGLKMTTDLVILDVEGPGTLEEGPKARLTLPTYIPPGLHGTFVEGLSFDF